MKLSVLISTIDEGIDNIESIFLEKRNDVEYIVSHQYTDEKYHFIPKELLRDDVLVSQIPGKGLSKSRNNAIKHAKGDIAVLADDDVRYKPNYFDTVIETYLDNDVDVACFKIETFSGQPKYKAYPPKAFRIIDFINYTPSSIEITFRTKIIKENKIKFDERFGLGSKFTGGEESIFINDCLYEQLNVYFIPTYIVQHSFERTNSKLSRFHPLRLEKGAAVRCRINGITEVGKIFIRPFIVMNNLINYKVNPIVYMYYQLKSAIYILLSDRRYNNKESSFHFSFKDKHK